MKKLYDDLVEQIILGILLNNNNYYDKIVDLIYPTDFFHETHQKIFITLENLIQKNQLANAVIVSNYTPEVESEYICNLAKDFIPPDNLLDYIRVLKELSQKRKLYNISDYIEKHLHNIDIKEQIEKIEQLIYNIHLKDEKTTVKFFEGTKQIIEYIKDIQEGKRKKIGILSNFKDLDHFLGGFKKGEITILAARPSTGKTALCTQIGLNIAKQKQGVLFVSLEMPWEQICFRMISHFSKIHLGSLMHARVDSVQLNKCIKDLQELEKLPFYIYDCSSLSPNLLRSKIREMIRKNNVEFVIIDYLQLMGCTKLESRNQEISYISRNLKIIAKELNIPILVLSQMSRDVEKRKDGPKISDLRDSGSIEQDADSIVFLYREPTDGNEKVSVFVAKNRNGPLGHFKLEFQGEITSFKDIPFTN